MVKISDELYGGYLDYKGIPTAEELKVTKKNEKEFTLKIPKHCKPVFFSKREMMLVHSFKGGAGNLVQNIAETMYKQPYPGSKKVHMFGNHFALQGEYVAGYESIIVPRVEGVYQFKILGIFDLDYWKLKFLD